MEQEKNIISKLESLEQKIDITYKNLIAIVTQLTKQLEWQAKRSEFTHESTEEYLKLIDNRISLLKKNVFQMNEAKKPEAVKIECAFARFKKEHSILSVALEFVPELTQSGHYYKGTCPFCRDPESFTLSPSKDIYYCFKCHKGGDQISLICQLKNLTPEQFVLEQSVLQEE